MKKKKASLFEETKIQMVMNIFDISRSKAIEYIASRSTGGGQKTDGGSKSDRNIRSRNAGEWMSAEEFFADED